MFDASKIEKSVPMSQLEALADFAKKFQVGDSYLCADRRQAGQLRRAIEAVHGDRTSTERTNEQGIRVWRIQQRPPIVRKKKVQG